MKLPKLVDSEVELQFADELNINVDEWICFNRVLLVLFIIFKGPKRNVLSSCLIKLYTCEYYSTWLQWDNISNDLIRLKCPCNKYAHSLNGSWTFAYIARIRFRYSYISPAVKHIKPSQVKKRGRIKTASSSGDKAVDTRIYWLHCFCRFSKKFNLT